MKKVIIIIIIIEGIMCSFAQNQKKIAINLQIDSCYFNTSKIYVNIFLKNLSCKSIKCLLDAGYTTNPSNSIFSIQDSVVGDTIILPLFHFKLGHGDGYGHCSGCDSLSIISYSYNNKNILTLKRWQKHKIKIVIAKEQFLRANYLRIVMYFVQDDFYKKPQVVTYKLSEILKKIQEE